ncbi:hypothetical protein A3D42_01700 [Candidatus Nomurabacteria bacterium RIFCSPHIGHO2_02_FULL_41_18]|uniref:Uncharacterized protein n=1 Tax=Candidatus Nomurabacteria bacterium RIFCSPHIGHO2_02_FULL_41_18 TaxID=1801754 RepID=A0A1F6W8G2_9BACT|nr:MAG: hypothetical protein A2737_01645 [Candidatus Nomurabacteria bacterium RIFCSPHIGHO2_01_FULL_41_71]OGI77975.1 MAG: hypothetical protein A3D42_01700 [Candidatus Nomurabacteria bacterium RIFCSPHIGHO2_02_FULL_41_18]OGI90254.1 MAG: hypothetical protein A3B01_03025 [Candidatus Nomurabacteria bacterium RIFCSPLOWO2_01_FULL_41_52b]OGJ00417.1 MAG: hypothetical protein A3I90_00820 [Candidatus Nomurabacteria bacterium RIFCSPLOWO2_02_FULL_41_9]
MADAIRICYIVNMADFKSRITGMLSRIKDWDINILAREVVKELDRFLIAKLAKQEVILSRDDKREIIEKGNAVIDSEEWVELDAAILNFEQKIASLVDLYPGEIEFAVATHLQSIFAEVAEWTDRFSEKRVETPNKDNESAKKGGIVLPFRPEKGRH